MAENRFGFTTLDTSSKQWQLTKSADVGVIDDYSNETLAIAGNDILVYKLLGVHEQGLMTDLTGNGVAISGGDAGGYSALDAFYDGKNPCSGHQFWRSSQKGEDVIKKAYIGYNFGVPKLFNGRDRYGVDVGIMHHITTIKIAQSDNPNRRALKVRIERSGDGELWYGVDILQLEDTNELKQYSFKQSAVSRYWRIRPITFKGGENDFWEVKTIELIAWDQTNLFQVQDEYGWIENRDRDYAKVPITIKGFMDNSEHDTNLTQIGFVLSGGMYNITANFNDVVNRIGRPLVIGDILELPSETQYDPNMKAIQKHLEITDLMWSVEGYTPGWKPLLIKIVAEPLIAKQETQDIIGDLVGAIDESGLFQLDDSKYSHLYKQSDLMREKAIQQSPLRGSDTSEITSFEPEQVQAYNEQYGVNIEKFSQSQHQLYVEDAIPPNGLPYTTGIVFPTNPKDKDYHRMVYEGMADNIPARLFRYSASKNRWIYIESDLRSVYSPTKPTINKLLGSANSISPKEIEKLNK